MSDQLATNTANSEAAQVTDVQSEQASEALENDSTVEAVAQEETKAEEKALPKKLKKLKLKVNQKEIEEELPFEIDEDPKVIDYLTRQLQLAKMGQLKAQDYSNLQKDIGGFFDKLKSDPMSVLTDPELGIDVKQLAAKVIEQEIEASKKSPEQLEKEKLEAELKSLRDEREKEKETFQQKELERLQEQAYMEYDRQISDALESSTLPKSPYTIKKMAEYMLMAVEEGLNVEAKDIVPLVEEEMKKDLAEMFKVMPEDVIEQLLGKDVLTKLRKRNVAKAKEAAAISQAKAMPDVGKNTGKKEVPVEKQSFRNFFGV